MNSRSRAVFFMVKIFVKVRFCFVSLSKIIWNEEEKKTEKFMLVAMGNGKFCGGGFKSCPNAKINDGLLDVACIRAVQGWKLAPLLLKYHQGTYINDEAAKPYYEYVQTPEFWLRPISEATISVDGEVEQCPELHVKVLPHAIKFVVPKGSKLL